MSYATITLSTRDLDLQDRVTAAAMKEAINNPELALTEFGYQVRRAPLLGLNQFLWPTCVQYEAEYASALANNNPSPGADEGVITDLNLTSVVQAWWPPAPVNTPQLPIFPVP